MTALEPFLLADFLGPLPWLWLVLISIVIGWPAGVSQRSWRQPFGCLLSNR